jgi:hypothetical protein
VAKVHRSSPNLKTESLSDKDGEYFRLIATFYHVFELLLLLCISLIPYFYHHKDKVIYISGILDHGPFCTEDSAMPEVDGTAASREPCTPIKTTPPEGMPNSDRRNFTFSYILNSLRLRWKKPSDDVRIHLTRQQSPSGGPTLKSWGASKSSCESSRTRTPNLQLQEELPV